MKNKPTYKEIKEADYIIEMMKEDVFGHRVTSWSPKDTVKLHNKLTQSVSDEEKEDFVKTVEPLMKRKSLVPARKDQFLDSFLDLDTRVSQKDYEGDSPDDESAKDVIKKLKTDLT
jgi:hypothetical protein